MAVQPQPAVCRLCLRPARLRRSHVIPEFLHGPAYDKGHRMLQIHESGKIRMVQQGVWDRLLCGDCETFLNSNFEQYAARVWASKIPRFTDVSGRSWAVSGLDYATFKLFHLSVLWRISVSRASAFKYFSLDPAEEEELRQTLLKRQPGPVRRYQILAMLLLLPQTRRVCYGVIVPPYVSEVKGRKAYILTFGGCGWLYFPNGSGLAALDRFALTEDGRMEMRVRDLQAYGPVDQFMRRAIRPPKSSLLLEWSLPFSSSR